MRIQIPTNHLFKLIGKGHLVLLMLIVLGCFCGSTSLSAVANGSKNDKSTAWKGTARSSLAPQRHQAAMSGSKTPVLLGLYTPNYLGNQSVIDKELREVDVWAGKRHAIAGFFMDIEDSNPAYNVRERLEKLRQNGYTAFINLDSTRPAAQIAGGDVDKSLRKFAQVYADWSKQGEGRMAFIAPFQEMNIPGETYSKDPKNFKLAYQRMQKIFKEAGVSPSTVRWVFAPNGWSENNEHRFENYYPGSAQVDVVAFSSYNWGYCSNSSWKHWNSPKEVFDSYIQRMRTMAPNKPIFIAQTATTSNTQSGQQSSAKDKWFRDSYAYLAATGVRAILYFNINKECDWAFYSNSGGKSAGYKNAVANPAFGYVSPADLAQVDLSK